MTLRKALFALAIAIAAIAGASAFDSASARLLEEEGDWYFFDE
jgi:hypothetical protein